MCPTSQIRLNLGKKIIGADVIVNIREKDLVKEVTRETDGRGANYVFKAASV